jgi:hypothetical protein
MYFVPEYSGFVVKEDYKGTRRLKQRITKGVAFEGMGGRSEQFNFLLRILRVYYYFPYVKRYKFAEKQKHEYCSYRVRPYGS